MKLTTKAASLLDYESVTEEDILKLASDALTRPGDASFWDEDLYVTHALMFYAPDWNLTNDYIIEESNYRAALEILTSNHPHDVEAASVGHWTYSRYSCIKVRVLTKGGNVTPAFTAAAILALGVERDYPLIDEELYSDLQCEVWDEAVSRAIDDENRGRARDDLEPFDEVVTDLIREYLGDHYGPGYSDPGWISEEWFREAVGYAERAALQEHQNEHLF